MPIFVQLGFSQNHAEVHFIDVGYGDAIIIASSDARPVLIDSGSKNETKKFFDFIKRKKFKEFSSAILTHPHENHFGNFTKLLEKYSIGNFYFNADYRIEKNEQVATSNKYNDEKKDFLALKSTLVNKNIDIKTLKKGDSLRTGKFKLKVLHPAQIKGDTNQASLVLLLEYGKTSFLFLSDIGQKEQCDIISELKELKSIEVIQLPHHGDKLCDSIPELFKNKIFIVSTGENTWGLPNEDELKKLSGEIYRTDEHGDISIISDGNSIKVRHGK